MTRRESLLYLIDYFAQEALKASEEGNAWCDTTDLCFLRIDTMSDDELFNTYRSLVNVRPPMEVPPAIANVQDTFLQNEIAAKGITDADSLFVRGNSGYANNSDSHTDALAVWQGDITTLKIDAIVNAANSQMLGCWSPCHACIDNCIHTFAGTDLRLACYEIIKAPFATKGSSHRYEEPTGSAKITKAYNLPCRFVLHTVGPIISGQVSRQDCDLLSSCYTSCLDLAEENALTSIAFCCISTGVFRFPNEKACDVAVTTVREWLQMHDTTQMKVVFTVFKDEDLELYKRALCKSSIR